MVSSSALQIKITETQFSKKKVFAPVFKQRNRCLKFVATEVALFADFAEGKYCAVNLHLKSAFICVLNPKKVLSNENHRGVGGGGKIVASPDMLHI